MGWGAGWAGAGPSWANGQATQVKGKKGRLGWLQKGRWISAHGHYLNRKTFKNFQIVLQIANHFGLKSNLTLNDSYASNKITRVHINQS
jgi:hypothetical protein